MKKRRIHVSLSGLTVISVTAAVLAAVTVCIGIFASVYSRSLLQDARLSSEQSAEQTALAVGNYLESTKHKLTLISGIVGNISSPTDFQDRISALTYTENDIYAVTVYGENGEIISCAGSGAPAKPSVLRDLSFDRKLFEGSQDFAVSKPHVQTLFEGEYPWVVTIALKTDGPVLTDGRYIAIDFKFSQIASYIDHVGVGRQGYCFITDGAEDIIYHPQQQLLFSGIVSEDTQIVSGLSDETVFKNNIIYTSRPIKGSSWRIISVSFTDDLTMERRTQIIRSVALSFVCVAVILTAILLLYSKSVNAPIKSLIEEMERFERDAESFSYNGGNESISELNVISETFAHMSEQIKQLMEQVKNEQTELRKTELKALQAQINPHFLYNTLDSIQWMCEQGKTKDAAKMVNALARLFRISISRGRELITIGDEMRHAESYLIIQSFRYREQFTYSFDVDPELEGYLCNKITVQPLIENAIYHGIDRLVDEGKIEISVKPADDGTDDIFIRVFDNGIGMTEEQCRAILSKSRSDSGGIGVKNVNDRLRIYFGEQYGLTIKSEPDVGTTVTVRIPRITDENGGKRI